jgi:hypothetical protein
MWHLCEFIVPSIKNYLGLIRFKFNNKEPKAQMTTPCCDLVLRPFNASTSEQNDTGISHTIFKLMEPNCGELVLFKLSERTHASILKKKLLNSNKCPIFVVQDHKGSGESALELLGLCS